MGFLSYAFHSWNKKIWFYCSFHCSFLLSALNTIRVWVLSGTSVIFCLKRNFYGYSLSLYFSLSLFLFSYWPIEQAMQFPTLSPLVSPSSSRMCVTAAVRLSAQMKADQLLFWTFAQGTSRCYRSWQNKPQIGLSRDSKENGVRERKWNRPTGISPPLSFQFRLHRCRWFVTV